MKFIDTHSHLFLEEFSDDLHSVIERAKFIGITRIFMPNIDASTVDRMLEVVRLYEGYCFPMIGLHPTSVNEGYRGQLEKISKVLKRTDQFIAIGEVGIDLYWDKTFIKEQMIAFETQVNWALEYDLPLVIHSRDSFEEVCKILGKYADRPLSGIFHSFTGTLEEAERLLEFNDFVLGINGVVTFKKSTLPDVLKHIPLDRVVLETDSPYLSPVPNRGNRNESANLIDTLSKIAHVYQKTVDEVAEITTKNALKVFKMEDTDIGRF